MSVITINKIGGTVTVDGETYSVDLSSVPSDVAVIQWSGMKGHIEYVNDPFGAANDFKGNASISSIAPYQDVLDLWNTAKVEALTPPAPQPVDLKQYAAQKRFTIETGGLTISGVNVATDRQSQALLTGAYVDAQRDPSKTFTWKLSDGSWVTLDAATVSGIAAAVAAHVEWCFSKEAEIDAAIDADTITTTEQIDTAFLTT